jgi:RNA methyltransferase, TrmH family
MLSQSQTKFINSLKVKKYRQLHSSFIVEGEKGVDELLNSTLSTQKVYACEEWIDSHQDQLESLKIEYQLISPDELKKISDLSTPNQVLAIAVMPDEPTPAPESFEGMALALDGIRDPGNLGTMIRTADWFGIRQVFCSPDSVDVFNPKVVQSTMGSFGRVKIFYTDLENYFVNLQNKIPIYGALLEGEEINKKRFDKAGIILIGSESHGIRPQLRSLISHPLRIPRFTRLTGENQAESLNASVANGIMCFEICKQLF